MSKSKKLTNRIIAVLLIVLGLILGGTWNSAKYCIGDKIFIALGISPWVKWFKWNTLSCYYW